MQIDAIIGETVYPLTDGAPFYVIGDEGFGMAPVDRIVESVPMQHGATDVDFRLRPRTARLRVLTYHGPNEKAEHFDSRAELLRIFRPSRTPIRLRFTLDNGDVRQFDCFAVQGLDFSSATRLGASQTTIVELRMPDPTCYDPVQVAQTFGVDSGGAGFKFDLIFPASFGGSTVDQVRTIAYDGTWREFPVIVIAGPITDPVITNLTTGDKLDFTGYTIEDGDEVTIDCRFNAKTVTDQNGVNLIAKLSDDSDLATFSLEADPEAPGGLNDIKVTGTGANDNTQVYLRYYRRFIGL